MYTKRKILFNTYLTVAKQKNIYLYNESNRKVEDIDTFLKLFETEKGAKSLWTYFSNIKLPISDPSTQKPYTTNEFFGIYCCDLSWAKNTTYCGGNTITWDNYPCVVELAKSKGISMNSDKSYLIGDFKYYPNGRKGIISTKGVTNFTCNDLEFKKSGDGSSSGCKSLSSSQKKPESFFNIKIPGDTKYSYGKLRNGEWFAINNVTKTQFNLTKCGYTKAIKKLEKEGKQVSSPQKTEPNKVTSPPNTEVNVAVVEPNAKKPVVTPETLPTSDKILPGQDEEMSQTNEL